MSLDRERSSKSRTSPGHIDNGYLKQLYPQILTAWQDILSITTPGFQDVLSITTAYLCSSVLHRRVLVGKYTWAAIVSPSNSQLPAHTRHSKAICGVNEKSRATMTD